MISSTTRPKAALQFNETDTSIFAKNCVYMKEKELIKNKGFRNLMPVYFTNNFVNVGPTTDRKIVFLISLIGHLKFEKDKTITLESLKKNKEIGFLHVVDGRFSTLILDQQKLNFLKKEDVKDFVLEYGENVFVPEGANANLIPYKEGQYEKFALPLKI
jgi:hypothetical protein